MFPPPNQANEFRSRVADARRFTSGPTAIWVRSTLLILALGLIVVFGIAAWLNPYYDDGSARTMETHRKLGLPPCTFKVVTGIPCPSCGMTTSWSLLLHADPVAAVQANSVGALLAAFGLLLTPWCVYSAVRGTTPFVRSLERAVAVVVFTFLTLMLLRWVIVVGAAWWRGPPNPF
jgi:hypothetical protein